MAGYDIVWQGTTPADDPAAAVKAVAKWADAGATWWLESDWSTVGTDPTAATDSYPRRLRAGPPPHAPSP